MARTSGLNSCTPTRSSLVRAPKKSRCLNPASANCFAGSSSAAMPMPPATCRISSAFVRAREIFLLKKTVAERRQQPHLVAGLEFRHQARAAAHDFVEKLEDARRRRLPGRAGLAAVRRLDVKDAHGPAQQHVGPSEDAHHGELARPHTRRLPRSIQTQKEMAAGEGTILDDSHGFVVHRHYANTGFRCQVPGVRVQVLSLSETADA